MAKKKKGVSEAIKGLKLLHFMACTIQSKLVVILCLFVRQLSTIRGSVHLLVKWPNCLGLCFPYRVSALFWIIFRKPQEKYLNYFQERLRQLNFLPVEEVGLYVCMVRGGVLTALALLYSGEIKICHPVCILLTQWKSSNFYIPSQATENLTAHILGASVVWKLHS